MNPSARQQPCGDLQAAAAFDHHAEHGLGWLALRYVAREMSADEQRQFEQRLADDQAAREAVAAAVDLAHSAAVLHAGPWYEVAARQVEHPSRLSWSGRLAWMSVGAAASVLAICFAAAQGWLGEPWAAPAGAPAGAWASADPHAWDDSARERMSLAWAAIDGPHAIDEHDPLAGQSEQSDTAAMADDSSGTDGDDLMLPDWIMAGLLVGEEDSRMGVPVAPELR